MDFFAAGGFQQVFSTLEEEEIVLDEVLSEFEGKKSVYNWNSTLSQQFKDSTFNDYYQNSNATNIYDDGANQYYYDFSTINTYPDISETRKDFILLSSSIEDRNSNTKNKTNYSCSCNDDIDDNSLQEYWNYLWAETESEQEKYLQPKTEAVISSVAKNLNKSPNKTNNNSWHTDLSEWEEKFLENYIEIPELIDILPERTALCTDNCDHFLEESARQLQVATIVQEPQMTNDHKTGNNINNDKKDQNHNYIYKNNNNNGFKDNFKNSNNDMILTMDFSSLNHLYDKQSKLISETLSIPSVTIEFLPSSKLLESTSSPTLSYICNYGNCRKCYAKPAHLKAHLRRHLGEKPYICNWPGCCWKFSRSDELARHRRSHSGIKPYGCDFCGKCFARSDHLTKHRKVHERRILAANKAGKSLIANQLPPSILNVRPGRKRKNQL